MAVVIGSQQINHMIITALKLLDMIGRIRNDVRVSPIRLDHHVIFLITKLGGTKPARPFLVIQKVKAFQLLHHCIWPLCLSEALLRKPTVKAHPEPFQFFFLLRSQSFSRPCAELRPGRGIFRQSFPLGMRGSIRLSQVPNVLCRIDAFRPDLRQRRPTQLVQSNGHGLTQFDHLHPGIVDIKFAVYAISSHRKQSSQAITPGSRSAIDHDEGPSGIGRDEL